MSVVVTQTPPHREVNMNRQILAWAGSAILLLAGPKPLLACGAVLTLAALATLVACVADPRGNRAATPVD